MSTIPTSAFADHLQMLDHDEFQSFVAELWSLAGWETAIEGDIVVARKADTEQRLLVLRDGRLRRFRSETPPRDQFDQVVSPRATETLRGAPDAPVVDANDLRHRLIYGCEGGAAETLWATYFDDELRGPAWEDTQSPWTLPQLALVGVALVLVVGALGVLAFGLPFLETESPPSQATATTLDGGLDADIEIESPGQTIDQPTGVAWGTTVYAGTESGEFGAFDAETGEQVWSKGLGNQVRSPLVVNGTVYVRSATGVHALDAATGETQWNYTDTAVEWEHYEIFDSTSTRVTVTDGTVYFGDGGELTALDAVSGTEQWTVPLSTTVTGAPTVLEDTVVIGGLDGVLSAYSTAEGEEQWTVELDEETFSTSGVPSGVRVDEDGESLLVAGQERLYEFGVETGAEGWQFESQMSGELSAPVVLNRSAPLDATGTTNETAENAANETTGNTTNESTENTTNEAAANGASETMGTVTEGTTENTTVYVADDRAYLYALDPATGERIWTYQDVATELHHPVAGGPTGNETAHSVYLTANSPIDEAESMVLAVNASTGVERWRYISQNESMQAPTVFDETLYAGTDSGEILAIETANGTERWRVDAFDDTISGATTVAPEPVRGDSADSRIRLGIEGHHDWLTNHEEATAGDVGISVVQTAVPDTIAAGEAVNARVSLVNPGETRDNTTIVVEPEWDSGASNVLETDIELAAGEAREVTFTFPGPQETGNYSSTIRVGDDRSEYAMVVTERPTHEVTAIDSPDDVWQEDETEIIASVHNTGDVRATTPVALEFNGEIVDSAQRTIGPNETVSVTFSLAPEGAPPGEYNYSVATNEDVRSGSLEVIAVDRREDAIPIVTQVFGVTLLLSGLALGWRVITDVRGPLIRRAESTGEP